MKNINEEMTEEYEIKDQGLFLVVDILEDKANISDLKQAFGIVEGDHSCIDITSANFDREMNINNLRELNEKHKPSFVMCFLLAFGEEKNRMELFKSKCTSMDCALDSHEEKDECKFRNYYHDVVNPIADTFHEIPKIFFMQLCRVKQHATARKQPNPEQPTAKIRKALSDYGTASDGEASKHVPENSDCYIVFPCVHNEDRWARHDQKNISTLLVTLLSFVDDLSRKVEAMGSFFQDENLLGKQAPNNTDKSREVESWVGGWIEDLGTKIRSKASAEFHPECHSSLRKRLSLIKILQKRNKFCVDKLCNDLLSFDIPSQCLMYLRPT